MRKRVKRTLELPLDIVYNILLRLQVKILCRFKSVSKSWYCLISDPQFQKDHTQQNPLLLMVNGNTDNQVARFKTYSRDGSILREFSANIHPNQFEFIQSCQGLVCLRFGDNGSVLVCNPFTEEIITLPERLEDQFLICDGIGYATSTGMYKVFKFYMEFSAYNVEEDYFEEDKERHCEVFTVGISHEWRKAKNPPPYVPRFGAHLPFLHGALHLMPEDESKSEDDKYIAAFDVNTEEYRKIPLPKIYFSYVRSSMESSHLHLVELNGCLCLTLDFFETGKLLELWFLIDYHCGKWLKQYTVDLSSVGSFLNAFPLGIMVDGTLWLKVISTEESKLCCYNTKENHFAETKDVNSEAIFYVDSFCMGIRGTS